MLAEMKYLISSKNLSSTAQTKKTQFYIMLAVRTLQPLFEVKIKKVLRKN